MNVLRIPEKSNSEKLRDKSEAKLNSLVIKYFEEAKDKPLKKELIFKKLNTEWCNYAFLANKTQKGIQVYANAFKKRVDYVLQKVEEQNQSQTNDREDDKE
jgi:hypothetical protein